MTVDDVQFRVASAADVPAMEACRSSDAEARSADPRMAAYFAGNHHPRQALAPRIGYVATVDGRVVGYAAGHLTTRHGCAAELQYLFVEPRLRRRGIATALVRMLADWFARAGAVKMCVCVDGDSAAAKPFYERAGAYPIKPLWYVWDDSSDCCRSQD